MTARFKSHISLPPNREMNTSISTDLTWASRGFLQPSHVQNGAPSAEAENDAMPDLVDSDHSDSDSDQHDSCAAQDTVETSRPSQVSKLSFIPQVPQVVTNDVYALAVFLLHLFTCAVAEQVYLDEHLRPLALSLVVLEFRVRH